MTSEEPGVARPAGTRGPSSSAESVSGAGRRAARIAAASFALLIAGLLALPVIMTGPEPVTYNVTPSPVPEGETPVATLATAEGVSLFHDYGFSLEKMRDGRWVAVPIGCGVPLSDAGLDGGEVFRREIRVCDPAGRDRRLTAGAYRVTTNVVVGNDVDEGEPRELIAYFHVAAMP